MQAFEPIRISKCSTCDEYWGPLSLLTISGFHSGENADFMAAMTALEVVEESLVTPGYLEK